MSNINKIINNEKFTELENKIPKINNTFTSTSTTEIIGAFKGKEINDKFTSFSNSLNNYAPISQFNSLNTQVNNLNATVNNLKP